MVLSYYNDYGSIKTDFLKGEIKKTKWKDRRYITDLIYIEKEAFESAIMKVEFSHTELQKKYPKQWKKIWLEVKIWLELRPKEFEFIKKMMKGWKIEEECPFCAKAEVRACDLIEEKKLWEEMGGLP